MDFKWINRSAIWIFSELSNARAIFVHLIGARSAAIWMNIFSQPFLYDEGVAAAKFSAFDFCFVVVIVF